ncbi:MAG: DUF1385 domain-containing protein [bacterium]
MRILLILNQFVFLKPLKIGGQALIEGVMMRSRGAVVTAVRRADNSITTRIRQYISLAKRYKILSLPVLRGAVSLFEALVIGIQELSYSADVAIQDEKNRKNEEISLEKSWKDQLIMVFTILISVLLGLGLFMYLPLKISLLIDKEQNPLLYNLTAGFIRIFFLVIYILAISLMKDINRIFEYHGAEHKSIFTLEDNKELTIQNARKYSTFHPRCGTSFLFLAGFACIIMFGFIDGIIVAVKGSYLFTTEINPAAWVRFLVHLPLIPLVSGVSYELLKWSGENSDKKWIKPLIWPGLSLQRITTREPDDSQIEVALTSLKDALKHH